MKRLIAFALVLVMALSMMVMTASAAPFTCTKHGIVSEACTKPHHVRHYYIYEIDGDNVAICMFEGESFVKDFSSNVSELNGWGIAQPAKGMLLCQDGANIAICKMPATPAAKPQPKTGVMDTLPVWFGVMAVSACAYVLTSKKKLF